MAKILVYEGFDEDALEELRKRYEVIYDPRVPEKEELLESIVDCDAIIVRTYTTVDKDVIDRARKLKVIARYGVGLERIDVEYAKKKGIEVVNSPLGNVDSVAELAILHMLATLRRLVEADRSVRRGEWDRKKFESYELKGKTIGFVGFGNIPRAITRKLSGFEVEFIAYDPYVDEETMRAMNVRKVGFDELLSTADVISLHVPLTEETKHMIGRREFEMMKPNAVLINTARGKVVDEDALVEALEQGRIYGAGLDVFYEEPPRNQKLLSLPNVVLTPHIGGMTKEANRRMAFELVEKIVKILG
ncbi:MAG: D-3-phosphoglycerate dehydrogenase / 2-oxoglutarate reductase [Archaeoglobi archaeon]|nr:hydroxyacid dehydrogenase [Candidatus Mnemosynella bozhongmuii]MDK2782102.1 D-3-phosphoglycerate dehydrogenase / 2-oxoglutarate reductase [Archaeoglobi archaeon]